MKCCNCDQSVKEYGKPCPHCNSDAITKISISGRLLLGEELELSEEIEKQTSIDPTVYSPPIFTELPPWERSEAHQSSESLSERRVRRSLKSTKKLLHILDKGLCESYCIFGVPGVGKTTLLMGLLRQLAQHQKTDLRHKFGGLILDPKGVLLEEVKAVLRKAGREQDLMPIRAEELKGPDGINIIRSSLAPVDLGKIMTLAASSRGLGSGDSYWLQAMEKLFGSVLILMVAMNQRPTLFEVLRVLTGTEDVEVYTGKRTRISCLESLVAKVRKVAEENDSSLSNDIAVAIETSERFLSDDPRNRGIQMGFIEQAYGDFRWDKYRCYSNSDCTLNIYDKIINDGTIVIVSIGRQHVAIEKPLCTLVKVLFQQTVLTRLERYQKDELNNFRRPVFLLADEYSAVATDLAGSGIGDSTFFSQSRQFGCLNLIATQNLHQLKNSGLGANWEAVLANMSAKILMRLGDAETARMAADLIGNTHVYVDQTSRNTGVSGAGESTSTRRESRPDLPPEFFTQRLNVGQAVVVGTIDGNKPGLHFVQVSPDGYSISGVGRSVTPTPKTRK